MEVLAVVHGPDVGPELLGEEAAAAGHTLLEWDIRRQGRPPRRCAAVVVLGGDQNVGEEAAHPWLQDEYDALRDWVEQGTPLLGVCLGAQTLAHSLGARVVRMEQELAGFYDTELLDEGARDPVLGVLPRRFRAFNGNAFGLELPRQGVLLARGPSVQAFRVGASAWGVQFHPEVRRVQVLGWWTDDGLPRPRTELERELDSELAGWQEHGRRLARAFFAQCSGSSS